MKVECCHRNCEAQGTALIVDWCRGVFPMTGEDVNRFEAAFAAYLRTEHSLGVTSCIAGLVAERINDSTLALALCPTLTDGQIDSGMESVSAVVASESLQ